MTSKTPIWKIVEAKNPLAVHAHCHSLTGAKHWIEVLAPDYCARGLFMDKTLTPESFRILCPDGRYST